MTLPDILTFAGLSPNVSKSTLTIRCLLLAGFLACGVTALAQIGQSAGGYSGPANVPLQLTNTAPAPIAANAPPQPTAETYHYDPIADRKEHVKRVHDMVVLQQKLSPIWYATNGKVVPRKVAEKLFIRPPGLEDDEGWEDLQLMLELVLQGNQPIEFYARVVDQDEKPVGGASLELRLSGVDTDKVLAKFPHMEMGEEQINWTNFVNSDDNGWVRLKGIAGHYLEVWNVSKEGYLSHYVNGNNGGVIYESNTVTRLGSLSPLGDIQMTNAWDSQRGYIFHLQKIGETNSIK